MELSHDEVIAWIDERVAKLNEVINNPCAWGIETEIEYRASLLANRDVLERHKVDEENYLRRYAGNDNQVRYEMCMCEEDFPCPTYTDIYNRIREVM